jgi:DNA polymerase
MKLHLDFETRSRADLKKVGAAKYAADPSTEVLCFSQASDDGTVRTGLFPKLMPLGIDNPNVLIVAHNAAFEMAICRHIMTPRHGWPEIPLERWRCTMAKCQAHALPGKLEHAARALKLRNQKDLVGHKLMQRLTKPKRGEFPELTPELLERLGEYCAQDVATERELDNRIPDLSNREQQIWFLDQVINGRGIGVDRAMLEQCEQHIAEELRRLNHRLAEISNGAITTPNQVARLKAFCASSGIVLASLDKPALDQALAGELPDQVREVLEIRQAAAHSSAKKVTALLQMAGAGDRTRGCFRYYGAATGRWSGAGCQPQNLKRLNGLDVDKALVELRDGKPTLELIGQSIRLMFLASPGCRFLGADLSMIEPRVLAWLAGDATSLQVFRDYDAGAGPDPYIAEYAGAFRVSPEKVDDQQRGLGKITVLALGYAGGSGALMRTAGKYGLELSEDTANDLKAKYRQNHPKIVDFWGALNQAAIDAVWAPGKVFHVGEHLAFKRVDRFLYLRLPSSRKLVYPFPKLIGGLFDQRAVSFKDSINGQFKDCRDGRGAYGGLFAENVTQAVARDLLCEGMVRLERANYPIVLHCHDEAVAEVAEDFGTVEEFEALMTTTPVWAPDLPIACKGWSAKRYQK